MAADRRPELPHRASAIEVVKKLLDSREITDEELQRLLDERRRMQKLLAEGESDLEVTAEDMLRFREQFEALSDKAKSQFKWEDIVNLPVNKGKFPKAVEMQRRGQIFYTRPKTLGLWSGGELLFKDYGSEPVIYGWNKKEGEEGRKLLTIYDRDSELMDQVVEWANALEVGKAVKEAGFKLFAVNSDDMIWATKVNQDNLFVVSQRGSLLEKNHIIFFDPAYPAFCVSVCDPTYQLHGVIRWL